MKTSFAERLRCPQCHGRLAVEAFEEEQVDPSTTAVKTGMLLCAACRVWYPIASFVPVMLLFRTPFHARFAADQADRLPPPADYALPDRPPRPGERAVQETFTDQWDHVHEDELSFLYTFDDLKQLNRRVWLPWLDELEPGQAPRSVLDVGCGLGRETLALQDLLDGAEAVGVDLNFALLQAGPLHRARPNLHLVIASLFDLPFEPASFDFVYSQGVIHHTYSTEQAFRSIARHVADGGHLFVWVYGLEDNLLRRRERQLPARTWWIAEGALRPILSRAPKRARDRFFDLATPVFHPLMRRRVPRGEQWEPQNTNHSLRDWLSPRYARRHGFNEVLEWFEREGFSIESLQSPSSYRELFDKPLWGVGATGRKR